MSRLIESWKKSGWEYYFYDDDTAGEFLSTHFPPEVREAYESIIPGESVPIRFVDFFLFRISWTLYVLSQN